MITYIVIGVVLVLCIFLVIYLCKHHANFVFSLLLRTVFGIACIFLLNSVLEEVGLKSMVGINLLSIPIVSLFGVPGVILLYGGTFLLKK